MQQQLQQAKLELYERVRHVVALYENQMELVVSVHKDCGPEWDWQAIRDTAPPAAPVMADGHERAAQRALQTYQPSLLDRLLSRVDSRKERLQAAVVSARQKDKDNYREAVEEYRTARAEWENSRRFAERMLVGDASAYREAIQETAPFDEISLLGSQIEFTFPRPDVIQVDLHVNGDKVIPSEILSQQKNGQLSKKAMPKTRFYEVYQDYVCSGVLRVAREMFALLPIKTAIVTAIGDLLNTQTGHIEKSPILSVAIPRDTLQRIRWEAIDPSDTMANFIHRMCFKKGKGLFRVDPVQLSELAL